MRKRITKLTVFAFLTLSAIICISWLVLSHPRSTKYEGGATTLSSSLTELSSSMTIHYEESSPTVTLLQRESSKRLEERAVESIEIYHWSEKRYLRLAVTTGVVGTAVRVFFYAGNGVVPNTIQSDTVDLGTAVARAWDKDGNGWVGLYASYGYDQSGNHVATKYQVQ